MSSIEHIHFVTGKLAEPALRDIVGALSAHCNFEYSIGCLPISVAALMTPKWLLKHLQVPSQATKVIVPGYLASGIEEIRSQLGMDVSAGPKDLRDLPEYFGKPSLRGSDYGSHRIEILAEINHANRLERAELLELAQRLAKDGADIIDLGCDPSIRWDQVGDAVRALRDLGLRISIDSFDACEVALGVQAGAELVLSVQEDNVERAVDWGVEVVVIPQAMDRYLESLEQSIKVLERQGIPYRLDPILEPIGCGLVRSIERYIQTRRHFPHAKMLMGIGNLTELTDVDSAGVNTLLLGMCEELDIESVLTTQVISWASSSVRECAIGRQLVHYAVRKKIPPKRLEENLVMLRDPKLKRYSDAYIESLANGIRDTNYRILVDGDQIHLLSRDVHLAGTDPFLLMDDLLKLPQASNIDASHAFYLGAELQKASIALQLGKNYEQDQALRWGFLTREEPSHRLQRKRASQRDIASPRESED